MTSRLKSREMRVTQGNLENAFRDAGAQLEPFAAVGLPLVALVTNPCHSDI